MNSKRGFSLFMFISGLILIVLGALFFIKPIQSAEVMTTVISISIISSGILSVVAFFAEIEKKLYWLLCEGVLDILLGIIFVVSPHFAVFTAAIIVGLWSIIISCIRISFAFQAKEIGTSWVPLLLFGILGILLGLIVMFQPAIGVLSISIFMAITLIAMGVGLVSNAF